MKNMIKTAVPFFTILFFLFGCSTAPGIQPVGDLAKGEYRGSYWPTEGWRSCRPEAVGVDSDKLVRALKLVAVPKVNTEGILVIRNGYIIAEEYFGYFEKGYKHISHSMAKSFTSTLVGIAIKQGHLEGIDEKICKFYPEWDCSDKQDPRSRITIRHAMTLTSGLEWNESWKTWDPTTNDALKMGASGQYISYMAKRKGKHEPGQTFFYSTGDPMLLSRVIQKATSMTAFEYARQNLFKPLNITNVTWESDDDGYTATAWGLHTTVRDYAKFGYLFLNRGRWGDKQIVPEEWVAQSTRTDPSVRMWPAYGYLWHVNLPRRSNDWGKIPADSYMAAGVLGQNIFIFPSKNLVIVRVANQQRNRLNLPDFLEQVLDAIDN